MLSRKHISFLIICLVLLFLLSACRSTEDYSSSPVIPGGEDMTHSDTDSSDTSSYSSSSEPASSSQTSSASSSKPSSTVKPAKPSQPSDQNTSSHLHAYKITRVEPKCTEDGYTIYKCVECGETKIDNYVPKKGHSWGEWKTASDATVLTAGIKERECAVCHEKETEQIPTLTPNYAVLRAELLDLVNKERTINSLNEIKDSSEAQTKADTRAEEIAENFVTVQGDKYAENIFSSADSGLTAQEVFDYWMKSEQSKNNILSDKFTRTAIGIIIKDGKYYWVQIFME